MLPCMARFKNGRSSPNPSQKKSIPLTFLLRTEIPHLELCSFGLSLSQSLIHLCDQYTISLQIELLLHKGKVRSQGMDAKGKRCCDCLFEEAIERTPPSHELDL